MAQEATGILLLCGYWQRFAIICGLLHSSGSLHMNFGIFQAEKLVTGAIRAKRLSSSAALNPSRSLGC